MKKWLSFLALLLPMTALAEPPHWSLEFKGGRFYPQVDEWSRFYGQDHAGEFGLALGYKWHRQLEAGLALDYVHDTGRGFAPLNNLVTGQVTYELLPVHAYALWRGVFSEEQWLVPYIGGGLSQFLYKQTFPNQAKVTGSAGGWHARAGVQLLLDRLDPRTASELTDLTGVDNSYLILEAATSRADKAGVDLGGTSYRLGFLFEF